MKQVRLRKIKFVDNVYITKLLKSTDIENTQGTMWVPVIAISCSSFSPRPEKPPYYEEDYQYHEDGTQAAKFKWEEEEE